MRFLADGTSRNYASSFQRTRIYWVEYLLLQSKGYAAHAKICTCTGMNVNRGKKILIRLRPANDEGSFYDIEEMLIGTMLHELTHNVHGPHEKVRLVALS